MCHRFDSADVPWPLVRHDNRLLPLNAWQSLSHGKYIERHLKKIWGLTSLIMAYMYSFYIYCKYTDMSYTLLFKTLQYITVHKTAQIWNIVKYNYNLNEVFSIWIYF